MGIALFRFLGSLCRNEVIASTGGSFFFLVLLLVGGFLLAKQNIPDWWIWAYWSVMCLFVACTPTLYVAGVQCCSLNIQHCRSIVLHFGQVPITHVCGVTEDGYLSWKLHYGAHACGHGNCEWLSNVWSLCNCNPCPKACNADLSK